MITLISLTILVICLAAYLTVTRSKEEKPMTLYDAFLGYLIHALWKHRMRMRANTTLIEKN